jgi:heme-degrading monooxygenase HmoA
MYINISVHRPRPGKEDLVIDSMHRYGTAARTQPGLREVHTLKDEKAGVLVGLAIWDSEEAAIAARPALMEAVKDDDFEDWEEGVEGYRLKEV